MTDFDKAFEKSFDFSGDTVFFPVRHHSPACSFHLLKTIEEYAPEAVLVEGPSDANGLVPYMTKDTTVPPFCIYTGYNDKNGDVSGDKGRYRAYYPFLDYSPELAALRGCAARSVPAYFIDMPYGAYLINSGGEDCARAEDDRRYDSNSYTSMLTEKSGCRDFGEFWEKEFELPAFEKPLKDFVKSVFALGFYMRLADGDGAAGRGGAAREHFMAFKIRSAREKFKKILVVTGSYHVSGLTALLENKAAFEIKPYDEAESASYLMPYTFESADKRGGYQAGIPFPAFYQKIWELRGKGGAEAYKSTLTHFIISAARFARDTHNTTLPDEINALYMASSLANLRGKKHCGVYELLDGARSAFIKGHAENTDTGHTDFMVKLLSGMGVGKVAPGDCVPPVVEDFRALCRRYKIKTSTVARQETVLDIVKNYFHSRKSRFMRQLEFLDLDFCRLISGPDYAGRRDKNLAREIWEYRYSANIETKLIDLSVYGVTVARLCVNLLNKNIKDCSTASAVSKDMISAQVMGLEGFIYENGSIIEDIILRDKDFSSLCSCLGNLFYLFNIRMLTETLLSDGEGGKTLTVDDFSGGKKGSVSETIAALAGAAFSCAVYEIENIKNAGPEDERQIGVNLKNLYGFSKERPEWCDGVILMEAVEKVIKNTFCSGHIYGLCLSLAYKDGLMDLEEFSLTFGRYLSGCSSDGAQASSFISGVLLAARDIIFASDTILNGIDDIINPLSNEEFLAVLPCLRYAFTAFMPSEIDRIAAIIGDKHGAEGRSLARSLDVSAEQVKRGMALDGAAAAAMEKWGIAL